MRRLELMCQGCVEIATIKLVYRIDSASYFSEALAQLQPHIADGLVRIVHGKIAVTPAGRLLLRSIAMCFDAYRSAQPTSAEASPVSKLV